MKIKERKWADGRINAYLVRVIEIDDEAAVPEGATIVPDDTPVHDWQKEEA